MAQMAANFVVSGGENRRGRPSASRAAAIERSIHAAALDLFVSTGFEAASMDAIAIAANVSKGTLYARYQNKEALFRSVLEVELEQLALRAGAQDHLIPDDLAQRLRHHARTLVNVWHWDEYKRIERLVTSATLPFPDVAHLWHELSAQRYLRFLADDMAGAAHFPAAPSVDWEHLANVFLHAITGWHRMQSAIRTVDDVETIAFGDAVIATIMAAVRQASSTQYSDDKD